MKTAFNKFEFRAAYGTAAQLPEVTLPEVAFSGRSNVGKSSLINRLCSRKGLAKTSSVPGKTVTVNFFSEGSVNLVDLPGYGYAKRSDSEKRRWAELMEGYFNTGREIALTVQLIDMRHPPTAMDMSMLDFLASTGRRTVIALTKCDKLKQTELNRRRGEIEKELADYPDVPRVEFSAETGAGAEELKALIDSYLPG